MSIRNLHGFVFLWLLVAGPAITARGWDETGHLLVAQVARERLTDKARARVDELAAKLQKDGVPYNGVNLACWADDIKARDSASPFRGEFKPWHYIDLGCAPGDPDALNTPPSLTDKKGDIVSALNHCVALIKRKETDDMVPNESVALALLMHLVGDVHQPLHCTSRYEPGGSHKSDAGGNAVTVTNLVQTPWPNLHTFWDEAYRRHYRFGEVVADSAINPTEPPGSAALKIWLKRLKPHAPHNPDLHIDFAQWARETHQIGCRQAYETLGAPYGSTNITLRSKYLIEATRTARRQLVLAGYRLAALLNELYGP